MLEENVISSAGARHRSNLHELIWMIRTAGRIPAQRDTLYRHLAVHRHAGRRSHRRPGRLALLLDRDAGRGARGPCRWWRHAEDTAGLLLRNEGGFVCTTGVRAGYGACHQAYPTDGRSYI
jgi:hypothetical protein